MCGFFCACGVWGFGSLGVAQHLSCSSSGGVSQTLEEFGSVGMSTFTVAASVHGPPPSLCGIVSSAASVSSTLELVFSLLFLSST